jgi:hypothetical protein
LQFSLQAASPETFGYTHVSPLEDVPEHGEQRERGGREEGKLEGERRKSRNEKLHNLYISPCIITVIK